MAQVSRPSSGMLELPGPGDVARVPTRLLGAAIGRLLAVPSGDPAIGRFRQTAETEGTDLNLMWSIPDPTSGPIGEVCLIVPGTGRTAMFFVSADGLNPEKTARRGRLVRGVIEFLRAGCDSDGAIAPHAQHAVLGQALFEPEQHAAAQALMAGGFQRLADLAYLKRDVPRKAQAAQGSWPPGVEVVPLDRLPIGEGDRLVSQAMHRSYIGTLDCPALCAMRTVDDVLDSHRAVGVFDPRLWFVVLHAGRAEGCMLLSVVPASSTVELVYLGVGPALRGQRLGRALLAFGLSTLSARGERTIACAVDTNNAPALSLYESMRFRTFAQRVALVCPLRDPHAHEA